MASHWTSLLLGISVTGLCPAFAVAEDVAAPVVVMYKPASDIEKQAQGILEKHCSRCHQEGHLEKGRAKPAKNFGNIMQLDQLLANVNRVKSGNADGSRIFQMMANKEMPYDVYQDFSSTAVAPTADELNVLRSWIDGAGAAKQVACITGAAGAAYEYDTISKDIGSLPEHKRPGARYITLQNLAINCVAPDEIEAYRQGVAKLLNSLSTNSDVVTPVAIDADKTILRFNIEDLNWTPQLWETIVGEYPYAVKPLVSSYDYVSQATHTAIPVIRADWFAFTAARPKLYNTILGLPPTFQELQKLIGVDVTRDIEDYTAKRAGFQKSGVSAQNRLIERHPIATGYLWTSYDFGSNSGKQSLFQNPLGPHGDFGFEPNGGESIFSLPNGFQAYYLNNDKGVELDRGPTNIVRDLSRRDLTVTNGISCMGCHDQGMRNAKDEIRAQVELVKDFPIHVREAVSDLYPTNDEMDKIIQSDKTHFQGALVLAGIDPQLKYNGVEVINALSDHFERELDLKAVAAEYGVTVDELKIRMASAGGPSASMVVRLQLGTVQRDEFQDVFGDYVEHIIDAKFITPYTPEAVVHTAQYVAPEPVHTDTATTYVAPATGTIRLDLYADKTSYRKGDKPTFTVQSNTDCHLTLVDVDNSGTSVVIFPNKFQQDNKIKANIAFNFPNADSSFDFKLSTHGTEKVIALCDETGDSLTGVVHDYDASDFTELGKETAKTRKIDVVSRKEPKKKQSASNEPIVNDAKVARTAIKIQVE